MPEEKDLHYFKFFYQKINNSTIGWKDDEFGAYVRLLIRQFDKGFIPDDPEELSRLITSFKKNWARLSKKFLSTEIPGQLRNEFMTGVREKAIVKSSKMSEAGKEGGRGKKKANALQTESISKADEKLNESHAHSGLVVSGSSELKKEGVDPEKIPIGIDRVAEVAGEVWKNRRWVENFCTGQQVSEDALRKWMAQFNTSICNDSVPEFDQGRYQKMFGGWLNLQKSKGYSLQSVPTSNTGSAPLKKINNGIS